MTNEKKVEILMDKKTFNFNEATARAYVKAKGRCAYCDDDIMNYRQGYSSAQIDHLLPMSIYSEYSEEKFGGDPKLCPENSVFSCSSCNNIKKAFDPTITLKANPSFNTEKMNEIEILSNFKCNLIKITRKHIQSGIEKRNKEYREVKAIIFSE